MCEHKQNQTTTFTTFADWCRHKDSLSKEARHTVEVLLKIAGTDDCDEANRVLSSCTVLNLSLNNISDISPLSPLTNLTSLDLYNNNISDISPLSSLTNLTTLILYENEVKDISPLSSLTNLTSLIIGYQLASDISPLSSLTNLTSLNLYYSNISDLSLLSSLTNLTSLKLGNNKISDISPLSPLTNLTSLTLYKNLLSDISPLSPLTNLTSLTLDGNLLRDISPLSPLTNLTSLNLGNNQISDLKPLFLLTNLTRLSLCKNQISDLKPLSLLTNLTSLSLGNNQISDLKPLSLLTNLTSLSLGNNQISDLKPLSLLTNLTSLDLYNNQISDILPLFLLTNLTSLSLGNNQISAISPQRSLLEKWRTLSTISIERQKAAAAVKVAYALISQAEPEIVFCSNPDAGWASLAEYKSLGVPLAEKLYRATMEGFSQGLWIFLREQMRFPQGDAINTQLHAQLGLHLRDRALYNPDSYLTPEDLVKAISVMEYCVSKFGYVLTQKTQQALHCLNQLLEHCGWIWAFEEVCIVCDRPIKLSFDSEDRLHAKGEPAIEFADGYKLYSYHGVTLPEKYGKFHTEQWQSQWLLEEDNAELRRVLIQGIGYDRICLELQATQLDTWQEYTLLTIDDNVDREPIHLLKMTCPSTGFVHALRVPPDVDSARDAIRWVNWGVDPEEFSIQT